MVQNILWLFCFWNGIFETEFSTINCITVRFMNFFTYLITKWNVSGLIIHITRHDSEMSNNNILELIFENSQLQIFVQVGFFCYLSVHNLHILLESEYYSSSFKCLFATVIWICLRIMKIELNNHYDIFNTKYLANTFIIRAE